MVAWPCLCFAYRARDEFDHRVCGETHRHPPWRHIVADFYYFSARVQINEINRELHAEGVYGFTRNYPQTFARRKHLAPQQTLSARCSVVGDDNVAGEQCLACYVRDPHASVRYWPAIWSEAVQQLGIYPSRQFHRLSIVLILNRKETKSKSIEERTSLPHWCQTTPRTSYRSPAASPAACS